MHRLEGCGNANNSTLIQCHLHAFDYFGGYTEELLYDNIKTVILKRAIRAGDHQWNPKFEDFFTHLGFIPRVCKPYCLQTKGKVENSIGEAYVSYQGNRYSVPYRYAGREAVLELQDSRMDVRVDTEVIGTHLVVPGHSRVIREREHFAGLLAEAMRCNARCSRKTSRPLFTMVTPQVEHRPLAVYDAFTDEVHP